jgi:hypothetical protein
VNPPLLPSELLLPFWDEGGAGEGARDELDDGPAEPCEGTCKLVEGPVAADVDEDAIGLCERHLESDNTTQQTGNLERET